MVWLSNPRHAVCYWFKRLDLLGASINLGLLQAMYFIPLLFLLHCFSFWFDGTSFGEEYKLWAHQRPQLIRWPNKITFHHEVYEREWYRILTMLMGSMFSFPLRRNLAEDITIGVLKALLCPHLIACTGKPLLDSIIPLTSCYVCHSRHPISLWAFAQYTGISFNSIMDTLAQLNGMSFPLKYWLN